MTATVDLASDRLWAVRFLALLLIVSAYRLLATLWPGMDLFPDEAYYYGWSRTLDYGYYSKPPMVALLIRASTSLFGESEAAIRFPALMCYGIASCFVFLIGRRLYDGYIGFVSAFTFLTLPLVGFFSRFITTDAPLLLCWAVALYGFIRAIQSDQMLDWWITGLAAGLGLQSKYTMIVFAPCALGYVLSCARLRPLLVARGFHLAWLTSLLVFAPNLLWNAQNHFVSFTHTAEISQLDRALLHPDQLLEFTASQLLVFGPVSFLCLVALTGWVRRWWPDERLRLLIFFSMPFLGLIMVQSLLSRAFYNWAAPAYVAGSIAVCAWLCTTNGACSKPNTSPSDLPRRWRKALFQLALILNVGLCLGIYHYDALARAVGIDLQRRTDLYSRIKGWSQTGAKLNEMLRRYPDTAVVFDDRKTMAAMLYYAPRTRGRSYMWNPDGRISDHYRFRADAKLILGQAVIVVAQHLTKDYLTARISDLALLGLISVRTHPDQIRELGVYSGERFNHY